MKKLTLKDYLVYGSASAGDTLSYTMVSSYLMFFLTTVSGVRPDVAGMITGLGAIFNALINPLIGYAADRIETIHGRRRPLIAVFSVILGIALLLLFTNLPIDPVLKPLYISLMLFLFWMGYTGYFVPYQALGVDYTDDYQERTTLRLFASTFNMLGNLAAMVSPTALVGFLVSRGSTPSQAWHHTALILSIAAVISILITVFFSREKDPSCPANHFCLRNHNPQGNILIGIFREYASVACLKPMKRLILISITSLIAYTMVLSDMVYFFTYNMRFSPGLISLSLAARPVLGLLLAPIIGIIIKKLDKPATFISFYIAAFAGMCFLFIHGIQGSATFALYLIMAAFCTNIYWMIVPSMYYDICDYDLLVTGKHRASTIVSFQGLIEAVSSGAGSMILGFVLHRSGFNGSLAHQMTLAETWIGHCTTIIPVLFMTIAIFAMWKYPITRSSHQKIRVQLIKRKKK